MSISAVNRLSNASANNSSSNFTTSSITWTAGRLYVAVVAFDNVNGGADISSISRTGVTWTLRDTRTFSSSVSMYIWTGACTSGSTAGLTVNRNGVSSNCGVIIDEISNIDTTSTVVQEISTTSTSGTTTVTHAAFGSANNGVYAVAYSTNTVASTALTKEAAWTTLVTPTNFPGSRATSTAYFPDNDTTATFTFNTAGSPTVAVWSMEVKGLAAAASNSPIFIFCGM